MKLVTDINGITHGLAQGCWPAGHVDANARRIVGTVRPYLTCFACIEWWRQYLSVYAEAANVRYSNTD